MPSRLSEKSARIVIATEFARKCAFPCLPPPPGCEPRLGSTGCATSGSEQIVISIAAPYLPLRPPKGEPLLLAAPRARQRVPAFCVCRHRPGREVISGRCDGPCRSNRARAGKIIAALLSQGKETAGVSSLRQKRESRLPGIRNTREAPDISSLLRGSISQRCKHFAKDAYCDALCRVEEKL